MAVATWVGSPRSFTAGRPRPIQYVVIHATAGSEGTRSAENGAAYDKTRTDGTSTHVFADTDSLLCEVRDGDQAHAARRIGNAIGLQLEICGSADQTATQWVDALSAPTLVLAARQTAEWCHLHDIPVRRLSVAETRAAWFAPAGQRPKGIVGHVDVTKAYPEDAGTHYDPGAQFPWAGFLQMVQAELDAINGVTPQPKEDDVPPKFVWCNGSLYVVNGGTVHPVATTSGWAKLFRANGWVWDKTMDADPSRGVQVTPDELASLGRNTTTLGAGGLPPVYKIELSGATGTATAAQ